MASQLKWAIILIIIAFLHPTVSQEAIIVSGPSDQSVDQYHPVLFHCSVTNYDITTQVISWVIDEIPISYDAQIDADAIDGLLGPGHPVRYAVFIGVMEEVYTIDLNITSALGADSGRYFSCAVCTRDSKRKCGMIQIESVAANLDVNYRPDTSVFPTCYSNLPESPGTPDSINQTTVILGKPVVLNCNSETANPPVALQWLKNDVEIHGTSSESKHFIHLRYQFTAALPDENTSFKCTLRSDYFNVDAECVLPPVKVVSYPTVSLKSPGAVEAEKVHEFVCTATSNTSNAKEFRYSWTHDRSYNEPVIYSTEFGSVFSIKALSTDNGAEVKCKVTDTDGMESFSVGNIKIKSELSIGAIVGIVAAGIVVISLVVLVMFLVVRKNHKEKSKKNWPPPPYAILM